MKNFVEIAQKLHSKLSGFGSDHESIAVIESAIAANSWFTHSDICRSVEAICSEMLSGEKLTVWLETYPALPAQKAHQVAIIMAGNIPLVGLFDLLCTLAAGHHAWVKPSSKDKVLMDYICDTLRAIEPEIPIYIYDQNRSYDAVIATGGEEANRHFEAKFKETKRLCRANRHSIAVLTPQTSEEEIELLAEDIYSYSGLGCRNVAMIFAPKGFGFKIPTLSTNAKYHNNYLHSKALYLLRGQEFEDCGSLILIRSKELPHTLSTISVWEYDSLSEVEAWITEHDNKLQCIVSRCINHPRRVDFGEAQHPTLLDYADGVDTMKFLEF